MAAITVESLHKDYGAFHAVDGVSFSVEAGEVFALLGPNGAGKTTTVEILEGHRRRTGGTVDVLGFDPETGGRDYRECIGIVLQEAGFEEDFTVLELMRLYRGLYRKHLDVDELVEHSRSRGQAQRPGEDALRWPTPSPRPGTRAGG